MWYVSQYLIFPPPTVFHKTVGVTETMKMPRTHNNNNNKKKKKNKMAAVFENIVPQNSSDAFLEIDSASVCHLPF